MKFNCLKKDIYKIINEAYDFISTKSVETILQNVLIKAEEKKIYIKTSNILMGYCAYFENNVIETGEITVSCKKLLDIIREFDDKTNIEFVFDGSKLNLKTKDSFFSMSTIDPSHFPTMAEVTPEYYVKIEGSDLIKLLKKVYFCIANESSKISYNGAHFKMLGNKIQISASDFQRIAIAETTVENELADEFVLNIPKKTVYELIKVLNYNLVEIKSDKKQVLFKNDNKVIYSNLIESYIKSLSKLFEIEYNISVTLPLQRTYNALKRISTITNEISYAVIFSFKGNNLTISSLETEYGKGEEVVDNIEKTGDDIEVVFNAKLLLEILNHIESDKFYLYIVNPQSPVIIKPDENNYKYLMVTISIEG
ncbi:MAG: DNA polymerase III subunit beta [Deferribacterota bacterium]|nr:DNA polymerase III subunit beta [Deferribacterota bacterium]